MSSTRDPQQLRHHEIAVGIIESFGCEAITMSRFTSETQSAERGDTEKVGQCDLFVLLLGHRYGSCPAGKTQSYVELEYEDAVKLRRPRLAFLIDAKVHPIFTQGPERNVDDEPWFEKQQRLDQLRQRICKDAELQPTPYTEANLPTLLLKALRLWEAKSGVAPTPVTVDSTDVRLAAYLDKVVGSSATLRLIGLPKSLTFPIRLEDLYVPLHGRAAALGDKRDHGDERHAHEHMVLLATAFRRARRDGKRGIVLLGHPGAGKTTQLRLMALTCAKAESGPGELDLPGDVVPAFLPLRQVQDSDLHEDTGGPEHLLARALGFDLAFCRTLTQQRRRVLYLFDGLDEVPRHLRAKVSAWIRRLHDEDDTSFCAVTCRHAGYVDDVKLGSSFLPLELAHLREADSDAFVHKWYEVVTKHEEGQAGLPAAKAAAERLIGDLRRQTVAHIRLNELRANPLFLTIMCLVHKNLGKHMPDARAELYDDCIQVLLDRWRVAGLATRWQPKDALRVLQPVALHLHEQGLARQHRSKLEPVLSKGLAAIRSKETAAAFLDQIAEESGLFVDMGGDEFGFLHLGLQEYLAAREVRRAESEAAMRGAAAGLWAKVAARFGEPWWEEVILMLVSLDDPPTFRPFFAAVMEHGRGWHEHARLLEDCLRLGRELSTEPFLRVRDDGQRSGDERLAAERVAQRIAPEIESKLGAAQVKGRAPGVTAQLEQVLECGVRLVQIPTGEFVMGADKHASNERPAHRVVIAKPFWLAATPVTNAQYRNFVEATGHRKPDSWGDRAFNADDQPVVMVSWEDAQAFCTWTGLRLPSEAEWEYACRAASQTLYWSGNIDEDLARVGWYRANAGGRLHIVGEKPANAFGLYDVHGSVWEWCEDTYQDNYKKAPEDGSAWIMEGDRSRVARGGSWYANAGWCRSASRVRRPPSTRSRLVGFRPARFTTF